MRIEVKEIKRIEVREIKRIEVREIKRRGQGNKEDTG